MFRVQPKSHNKYKTKLCDKYTTTGVCPYGTRFVIVIVLLSKFNKKNLNLDVCSFTPKPREEMPTLILDLTRYTIVVFIFGYLSISSNLDS